MSHENTLPESYDYRTTLPDPEAIQAESQQVIVLNLHEPFSPDVTKSMFAKIQNPARTGVITKEQSERGRLFRAGINAGLVVVDNVTQFERVSLVNLPEKFYDVITEPTEFSWARLRVWEMPAEEAIMAFNFTEDAVSDSEIVLVPPHKNPLEPYVDATESILGKTPQFLQYTEIYYGGGFPWKISEYRPGLRNFIGEVSGAL